MTASAPADPLVELQQGTEQVFVLVGRKIWPELDRREQIARAVLAAAMQSGNRDDQVLAGQAWAGAFMVLGFYPKVLHCLN